MTARLALLVVFGLLIGLWEVIFYPFLPSWLAWRPLLPVAILLLVTNGRTAALVFGLAGAFLLDVYPISSIDFSLLRYLLVILVLDALLRQWLTNRSLYASFGLMVVGRGLERGLAWLVNGFARLFDLTQYRWAQGPHEWAAFGWDLALVAIGFSVFYLFTRRTSTKPSWEQTDLYGIR